MIFTLNQAEVVFTNEREYIVDVHIEFKLST